MVIGQLDTGNSPIMQPGRGLCYARCLSPSLPISFSSAFSVAFLPQKASGCFQGVTFFPSLCPYPLAHGARRVTCAALAIVYTLFPSLSISCDAFCSCPYRSTAEELGNRPAGRRWRVCALSHPVPPSPILSHLISPHPIPCRSCQPILALPM